MAFSDNTTPYKTISISEALALSHEYGKCVTTQTLIKWVEEHVPKLGHQPGGTGGKHYIFKEPFIAFISGQEELCVQLLTEMAQVPPKEIDRG